MSIAARAKQIAHESVNTIEEGILASVRTVEGAATGAAAKTGQATYELTSSAIKEAGDVGAAAIQTAGEVAVSGLKGLSEGGQVFARQFIGHALLASKELGVGALMTAESVGKAIESQDVQSKIEASAKYLAEAGLLTTEDVALVAVLITKTLSTALIKAVARAGGGRRRKHSRKTRRYRLKRRTTRHR